MATTVEELAVRFSAQTEDLTRELRRLESSAERTGKRTVKKISGIQKSLDAVGKAAKSAGGLLAGAFAARAVVGGIRDTFAAMNDLQTAAEGLGASTETIQELRFAFTAVGADASKVEAVLRDFTKRIGEARQNLGTLFPFLKKFNIELQNIDGSAKTVDTLMNEVANKIQKMKNSTDRAALANAAFGRTWIDVVAVMQKGEKGLAGLRQEARDTGAVLSEDMVKAAAEADAQFNILTLTVGTKMKRALLELFDAFNLLEKGPIVEIDKEIAALDARLAELSEKKLNIEAGRISIIGTEAFFDKRQKVVLRETNEAIESTIKKLNVLLKKRNEITKPFDLPEVKDTPSGDGGTGTSDAEAQKQLKELEQVKAKVAADLDSLRQEVFKINNDVFAIINESARRELEAFKTTFAGKVGFEEAFLEAKKLIEAKRVAATVEAQEKIDDAARAAHEKSTSEKLAKDKEAADEAARILQDNMREAQRHADDFASSFQSAFDELIFAGGKLSDVLKGLLKDLARMVLHKAILGPLSDAIGGKVSKAFGFAAGGVMTSGGPAPLNHYAAGGIATSPQTAVFGEGARPEAFVPLSDGRNIPVRMEGGAGAGGGITQIEQKIFFTPDVQPTVRAEILNMVPAIVEASKAAVFAAQGGIR